MQDSIANLKKIISGEHIQESQSDDLLLKEDDPQRPYQVILRNVPDGHLLIKTDAFKVERGFLQGGRGLGRRADYALVGDDEVIIMELKSKEKITKSDIERQLRGSQCVIDYCASIGRHFFNDPNFLMASIERSRRYLIRINSGSVRRRKHSDKKEDADDKEYYKTIHLRPNDDLYYRQLTE